MHHEVCVVKSCVIKSCWKWLQCSHDCLIVCRIVSHCLTPIWWTYLLSRHNYCDIHNILQKEKKTRLQACTSNQNCCPDILRVFCVLAKKVNNVVFKQCFSPYLVICQYLIIVHCQTTAKCVIAVHLIISIFQYYLMCI